MGDIACDICGGWPRCVCNDYDDDYSDYQTSSTRPPVEQRRDWASRIDDMKFSDKTNRVIVDVAMLASEVKKDLKNAFRKLWG